MRKFLSFLLAFIAISGILNHVNGAVIDLQSSDDSSILKQTLTSLTEKSTIILKRGMTYDVSATSISQSVIIKSASGDGSPAILSTGSSSLNITSGSILDTLMLSDVEVKGDYSAGYFLNYSTDGSVSQIILDNVDIHTLRGVLRAKDAGVKTIDKFSINNSIVDSIGSYGVLIMDNINSNCSNVEITNSTFTYTYQLLRWKYHQGPSSIAISNCTFYNSPNGGYLIRLDSTSATIDITNSIFGLSTANLRSGSVTVNCINCYKTSDCAFTNFTTEPTAYSGASTDLWVDPVNDDFNFKDTNFAGKSDAGDPRWAVESKSNVATLSALTVSAGTLTPTFSTDVTSYTVSAPSGTTSVTVSATATDSTATITGTGAINVSSGSGTATVVVTAEDGTTTMTYTIAITVETTNSSSPNVTVSTVEGLKAALADTLYPKGSDITILLKNCTDAGGIYLLGVSRFNFPQYGENLTIKAYPGNAPQLWGSFYSLNGMKVKTITFDSLNWNGGDSTLVGFNTESYQPFTLAPGDSILTNFLVENCTFKNFDYQRIFRANNPTKAVCKLLTFEKNTFDNMGWNRAAGTHGNTFIQLSNNNTYECDNFVFRNNIVKNFHGNQFLNMPRNGTTATSPSFSITIENNVFYKFGGQGTSNRNFLEYTSTLGGNNGVITINNNLFYERWSYEKYPEAQLALFTPSGSATLVVNALNNLFVPDTVVAINGTTQNLPISAGAPTTLNRNDLTKSSLGITSVFLSEDDLTISASSVLYTAGTSGTFIGAKQCYVQAVSSDATLSALTVSAGTLSPTFSADVISYTVSAPAGTTSVTVSATATDSKATVTGTGAVDVSSGSGTATIVVKAEDGTTTKTYTVAITVAKSTVATLSALTVSTGTLSPTFSADVTTYTLSVASGTTSVTVSATATNSKATVTGTGAVDVSSGSGTATIVVKAEDGTTTKTYTVAITVAKSTVATLSALTVSTGTLSPTFSSATTSYTVTAPVGTTSVTVSATATNSKATVTGTGAIDVSSGSGTATIVVTAEDGTTTKTYTVAITVAKSTVATLSALTVSVGTLSPTFSSDVTSYTVNTPTGTTSMTITATATNSKATVSGAGTITFASDGKTASIVVTAEDGTTTKTYTVTVTVGVFVNEFSMAGLKMYPNPANGYIYVAGLESNATYTVFNAQGKQMSTGVASSNKTQVDLSGYKSGIYFMQVEMGGKLYTSRFIKE